MLEVYLTPKRTRPNESTIKIATPSAFPIAANDNFCLILPVIIIIAKNTNDAHSTLTLVNNIGGNALVANLAIIGKNPSITQAPTSINSPVRSSFECIMFYFEECFSSFSFTSS